MTATGEYSRVSLAADSNEGVSVQLSAGILTEVIDSCLYGTGGYHI